MNAKETAKLIRHEIKRHIFNAKFSIVSDVLFDDIRIKWIDGPSIEEVKNITKQYHYEGLLIRFDRFINGFISQEIFPLVGRI